MRRASFIHGSLAPTRASTLAAPATTRPRVVDTTPHTTLAAPATTRRATRGLLVAFTLLLACGPPPPPPARVDPVAAMARIAELPDSDERRDLIGSLRRTPAAQLGPLLSAGFTSPHAGQRIAAALVAGRRNDGKRFTAELLAAAADPAPEVRLAAARALGGLRVPEAFPVLQENLSHETATVRLGALRALARIDPDRAAALPEVARLQLDPDPTVSGAATKVARKTLR
jgi:hypothetical protein